MTGGAEFNPGAGTSVRHRAGVVLLAIGLGAFGVTSTGCHRDYERAVDAWYQAANTPSQAEPASALEREVLERLPRVGPASTTLEVPSGAVAVGPTYASAARRICRSFVASPSSVPTTQTPSSATTLPARAETRRVACSEGETWFLVPDLLEDGSSDGPEDMP